MMIIKRFTLTLLCSLLFTAHGLANEDPSSTSKKAEYYIDILNQKMANMDQQIDKNADIAAEIAAMREREQYLRRVFIPMMKQPDLSPEELQRLIELSKVPFENIDGPNTARLKEILQTHSWADLAEMGRSVSGDAFLIVQHSGDLDFQKESLKQIKPLALAKKLRGSSYALLLDRIATSEGRKQTYGTQSACKDGELIAYAIEDPENVDQRRKEIGLPQPHAEYITHLKEIYGNCRIK